MPCEAVTAKNGYICPVRGCKRKKNRRFSLGGLVQHIISMHGREELEKRLRAKHTRD